MPIELFDSHCHINAPQFDKDRDGVIARMKAAGLTGAVVVGCESGEEDLVAELCAAHPGWLFGAWALHPEYVDDDHPEVPLETILEINSRPGFVAVGETGLDYHWVKDEEGRAVQKRRFRLHIEAAKILGKPLIIHARDAEADALEILRETHAGEVGFVMHCFGAGADLARAAVDAGGFIGFTGVITFRSADALREAVKAVPLDRILVETDCPYMAPVPMRGKRNEPAFVEFTCRRAAELHGIDPADMGRITAANARRLFSLSDPS